MTTAFVYSDKYFSYDYGMSHPLRIERLQLTFELCKAYGLFELPEADLVETIAATESEILRFHREDYVEILKKASAGDISHAVEYGLGPGDNPVFSGLWEWSLLHTGGSLQCARLVAEGTASIAFNIAGGLHHAHAHQASGFCYVNDPVLAIYHFLDQGKRVIYLDIDAHHGDGVQWAFYQTPEVLTVSFHQDGRSLFPGCGSVQEIGQGEGTGYAINVPLLPGTDDEVFWWGFETLFPRLMDTFKPDVIVSQLGVDTFVEDPLAGLELTTHGFCRVIRYLTEKAPAWVALGGGGYNMSNVARAWTLAWAIMNGMRLPDELPKAMTNSHHVRFFANKRLRDDERKDPPPMECRRHLEACLAYLEEHALSLIA